MLFIYFYLKTLKFLLPEDMLFVVVGGGSVVLFCFREREKGEREREKQIGCLLHTP